MTEETIEPGYIEARAEIARNAVEEAGGRVTGHTWRRYGGRRERAEVIFEIPKPAPLYGVVGEVVNGEVFNGSYGGRIVLDPKKGEAA